MKRTMKGRGLALLLTVLMLITIMPAALADAGIAGTTIEIATRTEGPSNAALKELVAGFEAESGVTVVLTEYAADDYEAAMKTRMASNELPDVWETHGWSRLRYGEYLLPLNDEPWYNDMTELARGILEGPGETGYALMVSAGALGVACNVTAAASAGVDVHAIATMDDFVEACQKIIDAGMVPLVNHASGGDLTHVAGIFTSYPDALSVDAEAQLNGTWDWQSFMAELEWMSKLLDMGAFWEDRTTMDATMDIERVASGKSVFYFANGIGYVTQLEALNPENEYACIPFPAIKEGANRYAAGGEGYAVGIWNESTKVDACKAYLTYLSKHGELIIEAAGDLPAFTTYKVADSYGLRVTNEMFERYPDCVYENMWDREYMPSGMWPVFGEAVGMLYADNSPESLVKINEFLKSNYDEKFAAAQG